MAKSSGRRPLPEGEALTEFLKIRVSKRELADIREACAALGKDLSEATREALDEFVGDFQERRIFDRRQRDQAVAIDRRRGDRRRILKCSAALFDAIST